MSDDEIKELAISFYDQITDGDGYDHSPKQIEELVEAGFIEKMKKPGHYMITDKLLEIL